MAIRDEIERHLADFGCTRKESRIYLDLFLNGSSSVQRIAERTGLNRITVHSAVDKLLSKQLLVESREGKRRLLNAEPPDRFLQLVAEREREVERVRDSMQQTVALMNQLPRQEYSDPNIRVYKGMVGLKRMLDETLEAKETLRIFVDIEQFIKLLPEEELMKLYRRRAARNIRTRFIWPRGNFSRKIEAQKERLKIDLRTVSRPKSWKVAFYSWNDKLGIESLVEGQVQCTIIKNREIAWFYQNMVFDSLWELL